MQNKHKAINPKGPKLLIDAREAADMCGLGRSTWLRHAASGRTPKSISLGGRTLWRLQEILDWVTAGCPSRHQWEAKRATI